MNEEQSNSKSLEDAEITQNQVAGVDHPKERAERDAEAVRAAAPKAATIKDAGAEGEVQHFKGNDNPVVLRKNISQRHGSEKMFDVLVTQNCRQKIGPKWYEFRAGQVYSVPENIKLILKRSGKLGVQ